MLAKIGLSEEFLYMVRILFHEAEASVCLNGGETKAFSIQWKCGKAVSLLHTYFYLLAKSLTQPPKLR
jgi:hypothetical protein